MCLLGLGLRTIEQPRVAVVVGERLRAQPDLGPFERHAEAAETALWIFARAAVLAGFGEAVGLVVGAALEDLGLHLPVALQVLEGAALGLIDRDLMEVDGAEARQLGVLIGEEPALKQRILGDVDARRHVGRQEGDLLGLGEEVVRIAVQHHAADHADRHELLGDHLGRVEDVERQRIGFRLAEQLHAELPFREVAGLDGLEQVAAVIVRIGAGDLHRLVPAGRLGSELGPPVELDEGRLVLVVEQAEGVDAETLDHPQASAGWCGRTWPT